MSGEGVMELEAAIKERNGAVVAAQDDPASAAGATLDFALNFLRNFGFLLLEEFEFPPLIHYSDDLSPKSLRVIYQIHTLRGSMTVEVAPAAMRRR